MTQEDLAAAAQLSVRTIRDFESGRRVPRPASLRRITDALNLGDAERSWLSSWSSNGDSTIGPTCPHHFPPAQLPANIPTFVGRGAELRWLNRTESAARADSPATMALLVVSGVRGIGKSALVVRWAHGVRNRFPDGQLHLDLRGSDQPGRALRPDAAIRILLSGLGVRVPEMPVGIAAMAALYRTLTADRRILIVLDDACDAQQVRPLLPGSAASTVVVTSQSRMTALVAFAGAGRLALGRLTDREARAYLLSRLGSGDLSWPSEVIDAIVHRCAGLPSALASVSAYALANPDLPAEGLVDLPGLSSDGNSVAWPLDGVRAVLR